MNWFYNYWLYFCNFSCLVVHHSIRGLFDEKLLGDDIDPNARTIFPEEPDDDIVLNDTKEWVQKGNTNFLWILLIYYYIPMLCFDKMIWLELNP